MIYPRRPIVCHKFSCQWLRSVSFGEEWKPDRCGMVVVYQERKEGDDCNIVVDGMRFFSRWREPPFIATTKELVLSGMSGRDGRFYRTTAIIGPRRWLVLPDRDVEIAFDG